MEILVCIKQVPDPDFFSRINLDPVTKNIRREGIPAIMNPVDRNAIEAALLIKEELSGKVTAITMGPPKAKESLEDALAMGSDEAVLLCDNSFAGADAYATALTIAAAIKKFYEFDLILCGAETVDSGTKIVGPQLAEFLDIPYATNVGKINFTGEDSCIVERPIENGYLKIEVKLPALLTVNKTINEPRIPNVWGIMQVARKRLLTLGCSELGLPPNNLGLEGSPTRVVDIFDFKQTRRLEIMKGEPKQIARDVAALLRKLNAI